jgi:hypothetical protein
VRGGKAANPREWNDFIGLANCLEHSAFDNRILNVMARNSSLWSAADERSVIDTVFAHETAHDRRERSLRRTLAHH